MAEDGNMGCQSDREMKRVQKILEHPFYKECIVRIEKHEEDRDFCKHDMGHFLDVARIAMLLNITENKEPIKKDVVYGTALLHDIGRFVQYEEGTDHAEASAKLAPGILKDCGYKDKERKLMAQAIKSHRDKKIKGGSDLKGILYRADKASRPCYSCIMEPSCDWKRKKKNQRIKH